MNTGSPTAIATTCASGCKVKTLYDQVGTGCGGSNCDVTQATNSKRPTYTNSGCLGTKACMTGVHASATVLTSTNSLTSLSHSSVMWVGNRTTVFGFDPVYFMAAAEEGYSNAASTVYIYDGSSNKTNAATDNAIHAIAIIANVASSNMCTDETCAAKSFSAFSFSGTINIVGARRITCKAFSAKSSFMALPVRPQDAATIEHEPIGVLLMLISRRHLLSGASLFAIVRSGEAKAAWSQIMAQQPGGLPPVNTALPTISSSSLLLGRRRHQPTEPGRTLLPDTPTSGIGTTFRLRSPAQHRPRTLPSVGTSGIRCR